MNREPIAIIGIGCRFPGGAHGPEAFWRLLSSGIDAVKEIPSDRWNAEAYYDPTPGRSGKSITRWGGFIDQIDRFDAAFFCLSPREAAFMDPQQRILLETAWEALEDGGQVPASLRGSSTGVFVGISTHDYELLQSSPDERTDIDIYSTTGGVSSIAANRISYCLDLHGPSLAVDTACSSSLVAVHLACESLWNGTSSLALVGGVNALLAPMPFVAFSRMSMMSPTGRCRAFDAAADGFVRGEGAGVVVLKRFSAARKDGDRVYAVIRGTAANQDGRTNGLTLPSAAAQAALVRAACRSASVDPASICYVEAHGTGTPIGDPIEARALGEALGVGRSTAAPCIVGSVKTNIGHLEAGAGIAGIIKLALLLDRGEIPPNLHFRDPNPSIDFEELRLRVPIRSEELRSVDGNGHEIVAGVNSFGFGGSNAHAVLQRVPPPRSSSRAKLAPARAQVLTISAQRAEALRSQAERYASFLESAEGREASLEEICWSAAISRTHCEHRLALVAASHDEMIARLGELTASEEALAAASGRPLEEARTGIAFVFCGQGPQWWAMGRRLLRDEPVFRDKIAECDSLLAERADWNLLEELLRDESRSRLAETAIAQPAIFAVQVALAALWESWGIRPAAVVGHSVGEVAAAHVAGALDLREASRVIFERGRSMGLASNHGRMLAAALDPGDVETEIHSYRDRVALGAINGPTSVTLSGEEEALEAIRRTLEDRGVFCRFLQVSYAFHSSQMDPIRDELRRSLAGSRGAIARLPMISTVTGHELHGDELDAEYWWRNVRETVRFGPAIDRLIDRGWRIFLEVGPHPALAAPLAECLRQRGCSATVLPSLRRQDDERETLLKSLGALHKSGVVVDWQRVFAGMPRRVALPTYAWQRERFWHEPEGSRGRRLDPPAPPLLGRPLRSASPAWEGWLDKEAQSYLLDHRVQGHVVFPAAGYVEVALEAAEEHLGAAPWLLEDVDFQRALVVPEADEPLRLQTHVQAAESSFAISSSPARGTTWTTHCTGKLRSWVDAGPAKAPGLAGIRARCCEQVKASDFYRRLREVGLDFGPAFRGIDRLWRRDGEALARIRSTEAVTHTRPRYRLHPALLDACFQSLSAALPPGRSDGSATLYLPVRIERFRVRSLASPPAWTHALLVEQGGNSVVGDLEILDESGAVLVEITGFRCQAMVRSVAAENPESWIYESRWERVPLTGRTFTSIAAAFLPSSRTIVRQAKEVLQRRQRATELRGRFLSVESQIDELCAGYFVGALRALGWRPRARGTWTTASLAAGRGIAAEHRAVLERHLEFLTADGYLVHDGDRWTLRRALPEVDCGKLWRSILARFPALLPELTLIRRCGEALPAILRGELDALGVLAPGGSLTILEELYQDAPSFADYNRAIASAVARAIRGAPASRTVRILEVGAGTGGLTAHVLPRAPAQRTEYVVTDVSPHFVSRAEQKFFDHRFVRCRSLDLEKPPVEQGFEAHSFDIVLGSDTLHATARIGESLAHVRELMAPGGLLLLLEIDRPTRWVDLVFGLTAGWWRFQDRELRPAHALLDRSRWRRALEEAGFIDVEVVADALAPHRSGQSVLAARSPTRGPTPRAASLETATPDRAGHWLLLADRGGVATRLAALLEAQGDRVTFVFAGPGDPSSSARGRAASLRSIAELRRVLAELSDPPTGIVHLWSLDSATAATTTAETLEESEALGCHAALHVVQAFAESVSATAPRLWLVTRGAQPAGDDGHVVAPAQAPLWGLGRVIQNEHRRLRCRMIDLDPQAGDEDVHCLLDELRSEDAEDEVAWRGHARYASRVASASLERRTRPAGEPAAYRVEIPSPGSIERLALRGLRRRRPGSGEVEIKVAAAAINFRDVMKALAIYPILSDEDLLLGDECAGRIVAVGTGVRGWREGDDVLAMGAGCFASHLTVNARRVVRRPRGLTPEEAVTLPVAFLTAWYALHHLGAVRAGNRVLIHAATGGVGLAALQVAGLAGAEIFATAGSPEKRDLLRALGVAHVMDSRGLSFADEVLDATRGRGVDLVLNSLAGEAISKGLSALAPHGRFLEIGKRDIYQNTRIGLRPFKNGLSMFVIDLPQIIRDQDDLMRVLMARILGRVAARALAPLPHRIMPISEVAHAFRSVAKAQHVGKVVLTMDDPVARSRIEASPSGPRFARDATYLVTGGLGGFGLAAAEWMAEHGARHFVLVGRSGAATAASRAALRSLRRRGARVMVAKLDVADEHGVTRLLRRTRRSMPPLRGVLHAAMVLDDALLRELDVERFRKVMKPKVQGAWNLHVHTLEAPLDFFVLFSSVSSMVGAPAQGNYVAANSFLDALAHYRQALGLPAIAINWGQLNEVGYVARHEHVEKHLSRQGILGIPPKRAFEILGRLLRARTPQVGVVRVDWQRWARFLPGVAATPRFAAVVEAAVSETAAAGRSAREIVLDAPPQDRLSLLAHHVRDQVGRVLRMAAANLDTRRPLAELGIDSLMAFELVNRIEAQFGLTLQSGKLSGEVTIETLAASLLDLLATAAAPTAAAAEPSPKGVAPVIDRRVVTLRAGSGTQLFCVHPAGGLANIYKNLAERLPSGVGVHALQSRALYDGLEEHSSIAELANEYAATIAARATPDGHHLLGFSIGGLLALAVARALEERGERVRFVGLIDSDLRLTDPGSRTDAYVRNHIVDMYGSLARELSAVRRLDPGQLAREASSLSHRVLAAPGRARGRAIVEWLRERGHLTSDLSPAMIDRYFSLFETHVALVEGFVPPRIAAPLFVWERASAEERDGEAWRAYTSAFVERAALAGNHYELMFPPLVEVVAAGIVAALRRVGEAGDSAAPAEVETRAG